MARFIEESKLSKRARKELNAARRKTWDVNPISRKVESKKLYNRKRKPCSRYEDGAGLLFIRKTGHKNPRQIALPGILLLSSVVAENYSCGPAATRVLPSSLPV